jgi:adenine C2-methylase RlmN of 23S rRNA A2503 and tRNA A37
VENGATNGDAATGSAALPALTDLAITDFARLGELPGAKRFHGGVIRRWIYERGATSFDGMTDLSAALRAELARSFVVRSRSSPSRTTEPPNSCCGCATASGSSR